MIYRVKNSIFSLRELEYKIKQDIVFRHIINLFKVPDYSTFSLRAQPSRNIYTMLSMPYLLNSLIHP
ncbi:transposase [Clostridium tyrobutyricum]|uniref:transposase n=1 Tax=Clostridium tyrobutyricum TaxID=1519 RepID=UPI001FABC344|nr:transposase [Clostridium tyrobutyricum]